MKILLSTLLFWASMHAYQIEIDHPLKDEAANVIWEGLEEFNTPFFGHQKCGHFAVCLKDENGKTVGGVIAWMRPGIQLLCIDVFWLSENLRAQGFGKQLMLAAEAEGKKHGCTYAILETLPFQAVEFYQKLGYVQIGRVEKLYGDHDAIYMRKNLH